MSAPRFYCPPPLPTGAHYELPPAAAHHASRVLRLRKGGMVQIFDGLGNAMNATIVLIQGRQVVLGDLRPLPRAAESRLHIVLAQALCSGDKMDWIIQKATELGVAEIMPVRTQRSQAGLSGARADKRSEHWRNVSIAACEQCGRNLLPSLHAPQDLTEWLGKMRHSPGSRFILLPGNATSLPTQPRPQGKVALLIGPEGGFTGEEADLARQAGFIPIRLGPRILRSETAALAGIAALQTLWGDFS